MMLIDELTTIVGQKGVLTAAQDTAPFLEDWRGRYRGKALCVVLPASTEQVAAVVTLCAADRNARAGAGRQHQPVRRRDAR